MRARITSWILSPLTGILAVAAPTHAQTTVSVGPSFGYYRPLGSFDLAKASVFSTALPETPSELRGFATGGVAQVTFGRRLGVEARLSVANSSVREVNTPAGPMGPTGARVVAASLLGQYEVSPTLESYRLWLSAGPGVVRHGGDAYARYGSPTSIAGAFGVGLRLPLPMHFRFAADATTLVYPFDVEVPTIIMDWSNPYTLQRGRQVDALVHLGLQWVVR